MSADARLRPALNLNPPWRCLVPAVAWGDPMANPFRDLCQACEVGRAYAGWPSKPGVPTAARLSVDAFWALVADPQVAWWAVDTTVVNLKPCPEAFGDPLLFVVDTSLPAGHVVVFELLGDGAGCENGITLRVG